MPEVPSTEYSREFSVCHYNLLAPISILDFKTQSTHVVNYFTRTLEDVLNNYMAVDTSLFYEYIATDVTVHFDNLTKNVQTLFNILTKFSNKSQVKPDPVTIKSEDALKILLEEPFVDQGLFDDLKKEEEEGFYSTEIIQYINLTKIIQFILEKYTSAIIYFPFNHLKEIFFSYNTIRLIYTITGHEIDPKLLDFNSLLFYIFKPHICEKELPKVTEEVIKLEEKYTRKVFERNVECKAIKKFLIEQGLSNLHIHNNNNILKKDDLCLESDDLEMNNDTKLELITIFVKRLLKFKCNVTILHEIVKPYKNTLLNLLMEYESKFISREIFNCLMLFLEHNFKILPKVNLQCLECRNKKKWNYEDDKFFKDCLVVQIIKEAYLNDLLEDIEYNTCGCEVFSFTESLSDQYLWVKIIFEKKEKKEEEANKFKNPNFNYTEVTNNKIYKECKITKNVLHLIKYYYYLSIYTNASVIHYSTTHLIINVLRSKNYWYVYEMVRYIMKYLYDTLFLCWCNSLEGKNHPFEPFIISIYSTIKEIRKMGFSERKLTNGNNFIEEICIKELKGLFVDWESEQWIDLRLGYLNNFLKKQTLSYFNKNEVNYWLEDCITEPFMRFVTYFICEDLAEHEFLD